jgi:hypothetical protein
MLPSQALVQHKNSRDGQVNTNAIIAQSGCTSGAAIICDTYSNNGFSDWYLPSAWELNQCYNAAAVVNEVLGDANWISIYKLLDFQ